MRKVLILCAITVPDGTTQDEIANIVGAVSAQLDDPILGYDDDGNEQIAKESENIVEVLDAADWNVLSTAARSDTSLLRVKGDTVRRALGRLDFL